MAIASVIVMLSMRYQQADELLALEQREQRHRELKTLEVDPIKNLLNCFLLKLNKNKFNDDRKSIISSTKYLFKISNSLNI